MRYRQVLLCGVAAAGLSVISQGSEASQVNYNLIPGSPSEVVVTATLNGQTVDFNGSSDIILMLTSGSSTLDPSVPALDSFNFADASEGPVTLSSGATTLGSLSVTNLSLSSSTAVPLSGTNPFSFTTTTAIDQASFMFTAAGASMAQSGSINGKNQSFAGTITTASDGSMSFDQTSAINLGTITLGPTGKQQTITLKGDVVFDGETTVPVPAGLWLLSSGLGVLGLTWSRRRSTSAAQDK
jgi:hypothetical protein